MQTNHRLHERVTVSLDIVLECSSGKQQTQISQLSMGGCFIDSIAPVDKEEAITFKTLAPGGKELQLSGEIVYVLNGKGFGVRFNQLSGDETLLLEQIIFALLGRLLRRYTVVEVEDESKIDLKEEDVFPFEEGAPFSELSKSIQQAIKDAENKPE